MPRRRASFYVQQRRQQRARCALQSINRPSHNRACALFYTYTTPLSTQPFLSVVSSYRLLPPSRCSSPVPPLPHPSGMPSEFTPPRPKGPTLYDTVLPGTHDSAAYSVRTDLASRSTTLPLRFRPLRFVLSSVQSDFALTQHLSVFQQLLAGARFLDIRVSKRPVSSGDHQFWTVHGMVLCVPLIHILHQINRFHHYTNSAHTIVTVFRSQCLDHAEKIQLTHFVRQTLKHPIFDGHAAELRSIPISYLPPNVLAGLSDMPLPVAWGRDAWINTYSSDNKIAFLLSVLRSCKPRHQRDNLFVLGWTVTPSIWDVTFRVLSLGFCRPAVKTEATKMNARFESFFDSFRYALRERCNVIFFDCYTAKHGHLVSSLNSLPGDDCSTDS